MIRKNTLNGPHGTVIFEQLKLIIIGYCAPKGVISLYCDHLIKNRDMVFISCISNLLLCPFSYGIVVVL